MSVGWSPVSIGTAMSTALLAQVNTVCASTGGQIESLYSRSHASTPPTTIPMPQMATSDTPMEIPW